MKKSFLKSNTIKFSPVRKSVSINKAVNGFTVNVSVSDDKGWKESTYIAKTEKEAQKIISKNI